MLREGRLRVRAIRSRIPLFVTLETFWRLLGLIYFIAFCSLGIQAAGLLGSHGILPFPDFLQAAREQIGNSAYWRVPTLLWLHPTDAALSTCWVAGALCGLASLFRFRQRTALAVCLVLWISLLSVGQDFLSYQWDVLLSEAGFLAIFADGSKLGILLFRWLLFRLMFFSGVVKLASGDPAWRNLTALHYHYETQPLPTPLAWYFYQLPLGFQKASTLFTFFVELLVPFWFFAPRRLRHVGGWITIGLQVMILLTGNYTFFNFLTIFLAMLLFVEPAAAKPNIRTIVLAAFIALTSGMLCLRLFDFPLPPGGEAVMRAVAPFDLVNSYGLFAVMTTERNEITVEGSNDGVEWKAYGFRYKPDSLRRAPPIVAPHQPRLDWQMWFAALSDYRQNRWFVNFAVRLLQGEPAVLRLLAYNPFPNAPPKYIRASFYQYHFTHFGEPGWWKRDDKGLYLPPVSLQ